MTILKKLHIAPDNNSNTNNDNIYDSNTNPNTNNNNNNSDTNNNNINNCDINTNSNTPNKMLLLLGSYIENQPLQQWKQRKALQNVLHNTNKEKTEATWIRTWKMSQYNTYNI